MKKKLFSLLLIVFTFFLSARAQAGLVRCEYSLSGYVQILIPFPEITSRLTYTAHNHPKALFLPVTDVNEPLPGEFSIHGDLPAPWVAGSTYQIDYRVSSPFATITYFGPKGHQSTIRMVCH